MDMHEHDQAMPHGMIVIGTETVFLSHLSMFSMPEHAYQVILEAELTNGAPLNAYTDDLHKNPGQRLYSLRPIPFVLPDILPRGATPPRTTSFTGKLFRNHFEDPETVPARPQSHQIASNVVVDIKNVVHGRKFDVTAPEPKSLEYFVFGKGAEVYVAHLITRPPDFDQLIQVQIDHPLSDADLVRGLRLTIPNRVNTSQEKLQPGSGTVSATLHDAGGNEIAVEMEPGAEFYFNEDGDLQP